MKKFLVMMLSLMAVLCLTLGAIGCSPVEKPKYTVTIAVNESGYGTVSQTSLTVEEGTAISVDDNVITIGDIVITATAAENTAQYTYSFNNFTYEGESVTGDMTITANFNRVTNAYTVTIATNNNDYGTVDKTSFVVDYGTAITVSQNVISIGDNVVTATPTESTAQYSYSFENFAYVGQTVTGDMSITANFSRDINVYTVSIDADGGIVSDGLETITSIECPYGTPASELTSLVATKTGCVFVKWQILVDNEYIDIPDGAVVTKNETVKAIWYVRQINNVDETIKFYLTEETFSYTLPDVSGAEVEGVALNADIVEDTISIDSLEFGPCGRETKISFIVNNDFYVYNLILVNDVIRSADDFLQMWDKAEPLVAGSNTFGGYWELGASFDWEPELSPWCQNQGYSLQAHFDNRAHGFLGTFDGCGYTIKNINTVSWSSVFGEIGSTGVVKNLAITIQSGTQAVASAPLAFSLSGTIENIHVGGSVNSGSDDSNPQSVLVYRIQTGAKMNNIILNTTTSGWGATTIVSFGFIKISGESTVFDASGITNCFHIARDSDPVGRLFGDKEFDGAYTTVTTQSWFESQNIGYYEGANQSESNAAFKAANHDLSSFENSDMWTVTDGIITFNHAE